MIMGAVKEVKVPSGLDSKIGTIRPMSFPSFLEEEMAGMGK